MKNNIKNNMLTLKSLKAELEAMKAKQALRTTVDGTPK